jgi:hypothetical protein
VGKGGVSLDKTCASAMRRSQPWSFTEDKSESTSDGVASLDAMLQVTIFLLCLLLFFFSSSFFFFFFFFLILV